MSRGNNIDAKFCAHGRLFSARPTTPSPMGFDDPKSNYSDWKRARGGADGDNGTARRRTRPNTMSGRWFFFFLSIYDDNNNGREFVPTDVCAKWVFGGLIVVFQLGPGPRSSAAFFPISVGKFLFYSSRFVCD